MVWPAWWWLLPLTAVGLVAAAGQPAAGGSGAWQAMVVLAALGVLSMLIAWQGDGQEVTRHTIEGFAELRVGVLILFLVGVLRLGAPRGPAGGCQPGADAPGAEQAPAEPADAAGQADRGPA